VLVSFAVSHTGSIGAAAIPEASGLFLSVGCGEPAAERGGGSSETDDRDEACGDSDGDELVAGEVGVGGNCSGDWF
jgi:hypothetical protein